MKHQSTEVHHRYYAEYYNGSTLKHRSSEVHHREASREATAIVGILILVPAKLKPQICSRTPNAMQCISENTLYLISCNKLLLL